MRCCVITLLRMRYIVVSPRDRSWDIQSILALGSRIHSRWRKYDTPPWDGHGGTIVSVDACLTPGWCVFCVCE